jgi:hypothetical protein
MMDNLNILEMVHNLADYSVVLFYKLAPIQQDRRLLSALNHQHPLSPPRLVLHSLLPPLPPSHLLIHPYHSIRFLERRTLVEFERKPSRIENLAGSVEAAKRIASRLSLNSACDRVPRTPLILFIEPPSGFFKLGLVTGPAVAVACLLGASCFRAKLPTCWAPTLDPFCKRKLCSAARSTRCHLE